LRLRSVTSVFRRGTLYTVNYYTPYLPHSIGVYDYKMKVIY